MYSQFAQIYREMAKSRKHFVNQANILYKIISSFQTECAPMKVLDFACGTGDVAHLISKNKPIWNVYGSDASSEMLREAEKLGTTAVKFIKEVWNNASSFFDEYGKFDVRWIMGNSIAHWPLDKLESLFTVIANKGLHSGGIFICDMRKWQEKDGVITEPDRKCEWRQLGNYKGSYGNGVTLNDKVSYKDELQRVEYKLIFADKPEMIFDVSYNIFSSSQLEKTLKNTGLNVSEYTPSGNVLYPYRVFVAHGNLQINDNKS